MTEGIDQAAGEARDEALELAVSAALEKQRQDYRDTIRRLYGLLGFDPGSCRGCSAPIWWTVTKTGARVPLSIDGVNHHIDCPDAARFRKPRS